MIRTITDHSYVSDKPNPAMLPTVTDAEAERFLAGRTFHCRGFDARITPEQCVINAARCDLSTYACTICNQEKSIARQTKPVAKRGRRRLSGWQELSEGRKPRSVEGNRLPADHI